MTGLMFSLALFSASIVYLFVIIGVGDHTHTSWFIAVILGAVWMLASGLLLCWKLWRIP